MSRNKFDEPTVLEDQDAICVLIMRLLLLNPGTLELRPEMGIGIVSKWRYSDESNLDELSLVIQNQLSTYLPTYQFLEVSVKSVNRELMIEVNLDNVLYAFKTDGTDLSLSEI